MQENYLPNETDLYEDDDPDSRSISYQNTQQSQSSHVIHSLQAEIQQHHFEDSFLSHGILTNLEIAQTLKSDD